MKITTLTRWARLGAGAIFALVALCLLAPGSVARAGCVQTHPTASHFDLLVKAGAIAAERSGSEATPPGKLPSCSGPMCSKGPAAPPSSSWTTPKALESWACLADLLREGAQPRRFFLDEVSLVLPASPSLSIFHPPRRSSV